MLKSIHEFPAEQIGEWLRVLVEPESTGEMRVLFDGKPPIVRHYSSSQLSTMALEALTLGRGAKGVYFLLNPLPAAWSGGTAKDSDIIRRRWLLVDCDPKRTGTVSSTDAEKTLAEEKMFEVATWLQERSWPLPIIADSGNGSHLLYRIDLPADDGGLVARVLKVLAAKFSDAAVDIDTKVGNASRICKLYGTLAAKGDDTTERPHRVSTIIEIPSTLAPVPVGLLEQLANEGEPPPAVAPLLPKVPRPGGHPSRPEAVEQARKYVSQMEPSISGEHGHDKLLKAASVLVNDFGLNDGEALDLLATEFNPRCVPPWDGAELSRKIGEAKKNPPGRPPKGERCRVESDLVTDAETREEAIVVRLSEVKEEPVEWLWPYRIPLGKLTLLAGDPGLGKSFMTVDMAARVSTGHSWPDAPCVPQPVGSVVLFNCEDDVSDTVLPRFLKAGGNPDRVVALQGISIIDGRTGKRRERGFSLDRDLPTLIQVLEQNPDTRLVVIDPISAYCGGTDSHKNADVRGMLAPLAAMASKYRVAVVMVTHLSKGSQDKAVYRSMGSLAFAAAARAVWHVEKDNDDSERRLLLMTKMNLCAESTGLAYRLIDGAVIWEDAPVAMTADEHMADEGHHERKSTDTGQAVVRAAEWLGRLLSDRSLLAVTVGDNADDSAISKTTLKRAKRHAGVISQRQGYSKGSAVWWTMPPPIPAKDLTDDDIAEIQELFP